jgi:hypothetical protein
MRFKLRKNKKADRQKKRDEEAAVSPETVSISDMRHEWN